MSDVATVAAEVFARPFFSGSEVRVEHRAETPLKLALALLPSGVTYGQLNALALAVREVGGLEPESFEATISKKQQQAFAALVAEAGLPAPFRAVLEAASPRLVQRRDLYALYGVLAGALEKLTRMSAVAGLVAADEPKPPLTVDRPLGTVRG